MISLKGLVESSLISEITDKDIRSFIYALQLKGVLPYDSSIGLKPSELAKLVFFFFAGQEKEDDRLIALIKHVLSNIEPGGLHISNLIRVEIGANWVSFQYSDSSLYWAGDPSARKHRQMLISGSWFISFWELVNEIN